MKIKKVILNKCYGGFDVSYEAYKLYAKKKYNVDEIFVYSWNGREGYKKDTESTWLNTYLLKDMGDTISHEDYNKLDDNIIIRLNDKNREDETLIEVVEELGDKASGPFGKLVVVEIPDDLDYVIEDYDGIETLHQRVQEW